MPSSPHQTHFQLHKDHPAKFKAAVVRRPGGTLELIDVDFRDPQPGELVLKVHGCAFSNNDGIAINGLLPDSKFPRTPGCAVYGEVVAFGKEKEGAGGRLSSMLSKVTLGHMGHANGSAQDFKLGDKVLATFDHQGCAEYCTAEASRTCHISEKYEPLDQLFAVSAGASTVAAYKRWVEYHEKLTPQEKALIEVRNEALRLGGGGVIIVYGEGGLARLCITTISAIAPEKLSGHRVVLVTTGTRFSHEDYRLPKSEDLLTVGKDDVALKLTQMGGVKLAIAADQPDKGFNEVLDSMRYGGEVALMTLAGQGKVEVNMAAVLDRSLTLRPPPFLTSPAMRHALRFLEEHDIRKHLKVNTSDFTQQGVNEAWQLAQRRDTMLAPVVVFGFKGGEGPVKA